MVESISSASVLVVIFDSNIVKADSLSSIFSTVLDVNCHDIGTNDEALEVILLSRHRIVKFCKTDIREIIKIRRKVHFHHSHIFHSIIELEAIFYFPQEKQTQTIISKSSSLDSWVAEVI